MRLRARIRMREKVRVGVGLCTYRAKLLRGLGIGSGSLFIQSSTAESIRNDRGHLFATGGIFVIPSID